MSSTAIHIPPAKCRYVTTAGVYAAVLLLPACRVAMLNADDVIYNPLRPSAVGTSQTRATAAPRDENGVLTSMSRGRHVSPRQAAPQSGDAFAALPIELVAHLEYRRGLITAAPISGALVQFYKDSTFLGVAETDEDGRATLGSTRHSGTWMYSARAKCGQEHLQSDGQVIAWPETRPAIVVDLDDTILKSRYVHMVLWLKDPSQPIRNARQTMHTLARDYGIIYITARARLFRPMTQDWLREHDFPDGPTLHAPDIMAVFKQRETKSDMIADLVACGIKVIAGIGDREVDEMAFVENAILPIIVDADYVPQQTDTVVVEDWLMVPGIIRQRADRELQSQSQEFATTFR